MDDLATHKFVIVEIPWITKLTYHPMLVEIPIRTLLELIIGIPECFNGIRSDLVLNEIANEYHIDWRYSNGEMSSVQFIDELSKLVRETIKYSGIETERYVFKEWLDKSSLILINSKLIHDWI